MPTMLTKNCCAQIQNPPCQSLHFPASSTVKGLCFKKMISKKSLPQRFHRWCHVPATIRKRKRLDSDEATSFAVGMAYFSITFCGGCPPDFLESPHLPSSVSAKNHQKLEKKKANDTTREHPQLPS